MLTQNIILFVYAAVALAAVRRSNFYITKSNTISYPSISGSSHVRQREFNDLASRDSVVLHARTGQFSLVGPGEKIKAKAFVDIATDAQIENAAAKGTSAVTVLSDGRFHLDRQQPSNARGQSKVAVQRNRGSPSTIGQVVIHNPDTPPSARLVRKKLKESIDRGKETHIGGIIPGSKKAKNIEANAARQEPKKQRIKANTKAGNDRAKAGIFKKGNK